MAGPAAVPAIVRTGAVTVALFALCGYGPARLLLPAGLQRHLALYALPIGAACSTLTLTVLGLFHVPLAVSLAVTLAAGAALAATASRRGTAQAPAPRIAHLAAPLALAALIAAIALIPSFRAGFGTVQGQNGDAVLAVGTAELLRHAPPTAVRPDLPLDRVPIVWRSKLPIYYGLAAVSALAGQDPIVAFSTVAAVVLALAALGFFLFVVDGLGAPAAVGLLVLFAVGLDRIVLHVAIHPFFNQTWALFALPFVLLFAARGPVSLAALFTALALFTYPLLLPFPAVFVAVLAWRRRGDVNWRRAVPPKRLWPLFGVIAVPVAAVLVRGVVEKVVPAVDAVRPGGDLGGWSGAALPYLPFPRFLGVEHSVPALAILVAAVLGLRAVQKDAARALAVLLGGALLAAVYLRARGQGELFFFKDLAFAGPLILALAIVGLAAGLRKDAAFPALAVLLLALASGARHELAVTYDQTPRDLMALRTWDRELPATQTIRIDVPPSGWQLWSWYLLAGHRVSASDPLGGFFPHPPRGRRADLVLVQRAQPRPADATGPAIRANALYALYRLRRNLPGADASSRALVFDITRITY
ncbi:MAG TPA: hypothetical protein VGJ32_15755 [Solirubrobacteraceae bacterium]